MSAYRSKADIKTQVYEGPLIAEAVEELYFSLGQNIYSHLSDIHSNRYEGDREILEILIWVFV